MALLIVLLLTLGSWAELPSLHRQAITATGLPVYGADGTPYAGTRLVPGMPYYASDYGSGLRIYCCPAPYRGIPLGGKTIESRPAETLAFGRIVVERQARFCATDWIAVPGGFVILHGRGMDLGRFTEELQRVRRQGQSPRTRDRYRLATRATGLPVVRLGRLETFMESYELTADPRQASYEKTYLLPEPGATFVVKVSRAVRASRPFSVDRAQITERGGVCTLAPLGVPGGAVSATAKGLSLDGFRRLVAQLRLLHVGVPDSRGEP